MRCKSYFEERRKSPEFDVKSIHYGTNDTNRETLPTVNAIAPLPGKWPVIFVGSPTGNRAGAPRPANAGGKAGISCERQREGYY